MCHYNTDALNRGCQLFFKIADCNDIHTTYETVVNKRTITRFIRIISSIADVLDRKRKSYTFRYSSLSAIAFKLKEIATKEGTYLCRFDINKKAYKTHQNEVRIHGDPETCSKEEFNNKLKIMSDELRQFSLFLTGVIEREHSNG
jgi:hypothetical protein